MKPLHHTPCDDKIPVMGTVKNPDKVLYLDFDGVVHSEDVFCSAKRGIYIKTPGRKLFEWMPILDCLLQPYPDVAIVLSTSWVRVRSFEFAKHQLSFPLQARVIGATFHRRHMRKESFLTKARGVQIVEDVQRRQPLSWFAIDDDSDNWPAGYEEHLVRTNGTQGISAADVQDAIRAKLETL